MGESNIHEYFVVLYFQRDILALLMMSAQFFIYLQGESETRGWNTQQFTANNLTNECPIWGWGMGIK
jgi:hypothetical protein